MADVYAPLRAGTDIVFLGGLIRYVLEEREVLQGVRRRLHQRRDPHHRRVPRHRGPRRPLLRLRRRAHGVRPEELALRRRAAASGPRNQPTPRPGRRASSFSARAGQLDRPAAAPTRPCRTRAASSRSSAGTTPRYTPEMVEQVCGTPQRDVPEGRRGAGRRLRAGPDGGDLLRRRLDPAHHRRADDPRVDDPATAARQHRPARRRHPGPARPRLDPGLDRHPDALQPPARLPEHARAP